MAKKPGWFKEHAGEIVVSLVTAGLLYFIAWLWPPLKNFLFAVPGYVLGFFKWFGGAITISRWHYILLAVASGVLLAWFIRVMYVALKTPPPITWRSYRKDTFFEIVWRWRFDDGEIGDIRPYCPKCDRELVAQHESFAALRLICEHCQTGRAFPGDTAELFRRVVREVDVNVRNGHWRDKVGAPRG